MVADVAGYVPGYRLKQPVQVTELDGDVGHPAHGVTHRVTSCWRSRGRGLPAGVRGEPGHHDLGRGPGW